MLLIVVGYYDALIVRFFEVIMLIPTGEWTLWRMLSPMDFFTFIEEVLLLMLVFIFIVVVNCCC